MKTRKRAAPALPLLPLLTVDELQLLRLADYNAPVRMRGSYHIKLASGLITRRLLERDPTAHFMVVRCTSDGERAREVLTAASTKRIVDEICKLGADDPEAAASLEYALWRRVLVEQALGFIPPTVARAALLTTSLPFRRGY